MYATTRSSSTDNIGQEPATDQDTAALTAAPRVLRELAHALRSDQRLGFAHLPCRLAFEADTVELDGEVPSIAVKRRAAEVAAAHPAVRWVIDRLRVTPSSKMSDAMIADHVADALIEEPALTECVIRKRVKGLIEPVQNPSCARGDVCVTVDNGVVTLDGELPTRAHERLAGVLAWWVPGTRDVVDGLGVLSPEQDNDREITDAVRAALEKDPFVDASQLRVSTKANVVTLAGLVWSGAERRMAENDAWFVFGVAGVVNDLQVADAT
jgi:osmotically-inducible protein OsmY